MRTSSLILCVSLAGCAVAPISSHGAARDLRHTQQYGVAGPRKQAVPTGAVVARDGPNLQALLRDPQGPKVIWLDGKAYHGDFTIRRPVEVHGATGCIIEGSKTSTVLDVEAEDVLLDNLTVRGTGHRHTAEDAGIKLKGKRLAVRNCFVDQGLFGVSLQLCDHCRVDATRVIGQAGEMELRGDGIKLWEAHDSIVRGCEVTRSRDLVVWYSRRVLLEGNSVTQSRYGSHFMYAHDSVVRDSRVVDNVVGIFVMYSARLKVEGNVLAGAHGAAGIGIGFKESDGVQVTGNWLVGNTTGTYLDRTPRSPAQPVVFRDNVIALNDVGFRTHSSQEGVEWRGNDFQENAVDGQVDGGGDALGMRFVDNFWSDYAGYDLDHDGYGDVAFEVKKLSSELTDAHPMLRFFQGTAAMGLVDAVARAVPILAAHLTLRDAHPAMQPRRLGRS